MGCVMLIVFKKVIDDSHGQTVTSEKLFLQKRFKSLFRNEDVAFIFTREIINKRDRHDLALFLVHSLSPPVNA